MRRRDVLVTRRVVQLQRSSIARLVYVSFYPPFPPLLILLLAFLCFFVFPRDTLVQLMYYRRTVVKNRTVLNTNVHIHFRVNFKLNFTRNSFAS
jgi:hypothetical protein